VSLLVLSAGMVAALNLQRVSMQTSEQTNYFRTALMAAAELSDKMLGNPQQINNEVSSPFLHINYQAGSEQIPSATPCTELHCSPTQLAEADIAEWIERISAILPGARAVVCRDDQPWDAQKNSLTWDCHPSGDHSAIIIKLGWIEKSAPTDTPSPPQLALAVGIPVNTDYH